MAEMKTHTAWCQEASGTGTIWIGKVQAPAGTTLDSIRLSAIRACAIDWGWDIEQEDNIHCLGIARGNVDLVYWDDIDEGGGPMGDLDSMEASP
jgi:hypothetical protein